MNHFSLYYFYNLIQRIDHYLGAKRAAKSAKDATGKALDETKDVGRRGKLYFINI